jgi:hypothetical protein
VPTELLLVIEGGGINVGSWPVAGGAIGGGSMAAAGASASASPVARMSSDCGGRHEEMIDTGAPSHTRGGSLHRWRWSSARGGTGMGRAQEEEGDRGDEEETGGAGGSVGGGSLGCVRLVT